MNINSQHLDLGPQIFVMAPDLRQAENFAYRDLRVRSPCNVYWIGPKARIDGLRIPLVFVLRSATEMTNYNHLLHVITARGAIVAYIDERHDRDQYIDDIDRPEYRPDFTLTMFD